MTAFARVIPDADLPHEAAFVPESLYDVLKVADNPPPLAGDADAYIPAEQALMLAREATAPAFARRRDPLHGHRQHARDLTVAALMLMYQHSAACHYTEGSARWPGLYKSHRASTGFFPRESDCSSSATWALFNGLGYYHVHDRVNGQGWKAGYTGTMVRHGAHVPSLSRMLKGDAVIYGTSVYTTFHVMLCVGYDRRYGAHMGLNHGHEGVQYERCDMGYPIAAIKRYI